MALLSFSIFLVYSCFSNPKTLDKIDSHMGILKGWNSPKRLSTELCEYILNNNDNSDYVTIFGRVDMTSLYLTQREMMETSQFFFIFRYLLEI